MVKYFRLAAAIVAILFSQSVSEELEDVTSCYDTSTKYHIVQLLILYDRDHGTDLKGALTQLVEKLYSVKGDDNEAFTDIQFGLASYGKLSSTANGGPCYRTELKFTKDLNIVKKGIDSLPSGSSTGAGDKHNPLSALVFAARDKTVGWTRENETQGEDESIVRLIMFYSTEEDAIVTTTRFDYNLEGSTEKDECKVLDYPTVRYFLREERIPVISVLSSQELKDSFELHFYVLGIPYCNAHLCGSEFDNELAENAGKSVEQCVEQLVSCNAKET